MKQAGDDRAFGRDAPGRRDRRPAGGVEQQAIFFLLPLPELIQPAVAEPMKAGAGA
jgi:hypothetical protein